MRSFIAAAVVAASIAAAVVWWRHSSRPVAVAFASDSLDFARLDHEYRCRSRSANR